MYAIRDFTRNLHGDLFGGLTAAIVALPLALAFGISSGAGPVAGLYGAAIVGFFAAIFGGTPSQISGPTGPMTVVLSAMIAHFIAEFPDQGLALAFTAVFLGGCMQALMGFLRVGKYIIMVPYPVISGFMTGIGAIIILLELGPLLGFASSGNIQNAITSLPYQLANLDVQTLVIGGLTLVTIYLWRGKVSRIMPAPLLALVVATLTVSYAFPDSTMDRIGDIPFALPTLIIPTFKMSLWQPIFVNALMLAILGSIDSLLTSLVADNVTGTQHDSDQELIGQGFGNAIAGLFGGLPGAGATMRTMVNIRAGGRGPLSGVVHSLLLLAVVTGMGFLFENIPLAALAGILIKVGIDIVDWPFLKRVHRLPRFPVVLMTLVFVLTVFVDLITAVFVGVFVKNLVTISKLSDLQLGSVIFSDGVQGIERLPKKDRNIMSQHAGEALLLRITGPISYALGRGLRLRYKQYEKSNMLLIDIADASIVGISTVLVLEELVREALDSNVIVKLIGADKQAHHELQQLDLIGLVGTENCIDRLGQAFDTPIE